MPVQRPISAQVEETMDGSSVAILRITPRGFVDLWNAKHENEQILPGDIILQANRREVRDLADLGTIAAASNRLFLLVQRGDRAILLQF